jgi:hypothetical protein
MTQFSIIVNKKGTILSYKAIDADPRKFPVKNLRGSHFSRLIGTDCKKDLRSIMQETSKTRKPSFFQTFFLPKGSFEGPVIEWTIQPKAGSLLDALFPERYLLLGKEPE